MAKIDRAGSLVYSTFIAGDSIDESAGIAVDDRGNSYVTGYTFSGDFPTTRGAFQRVRPSPNGDAFVVKLNDAGSRLVYSTYLGGAESFDGATAIAIDRAGNALVAGTTFSNDFPLVNEVQNRLSVGAPLPSRCAGAFQSDSDSFVTKLNAQGSALLFSTYYGESGIENATGIAVDAAENAYVCGITCSDNFPTLRAIQSRFGRATQDAFLFKRARSTDAAAVLPIPPIFTSHLSGAIPVRS